MKIEFDGRTWRLDTEEITNRQAQVVWKHTGLSVQKWTEALQEIGDTAKFLPAWEALYWLMLQQNEVRDIPVTDVDFAVYKFALTFIEAATAEAEAAKAAEPDPTQLPADLVPSPAPSSRKTSATTGGSPDG